MKDSNLMSVQEVCRYLGICQKTLYRLLKAGKISGSRVGRVWRFTEEDVEAYLEQTRTRLRQPYYGRVFYAAVLIIYHQAPRKYQIIKRGTFFWLSLTEQYLRGLSPVDQAREEFKPVKYRQTRLPKIGLAVIISPGYFVRLPPAEQKHWSKFEIKSPQ